MSTYPLFEIMPPAIPINIFRAYDIRGIVPNELNEAFAYQIGQSVGLLALEKKITTLITAYDCRISSKSLKNALNKGLLSVGCNVIDVGLMPTPCLYFATYKIGMDSGIMVTASHNPSDYNGFKIVFNHQTLSSADINTIHSKIHYLSLPKKTPSSKYFRCHIIDRYIAEIINSISLKKPLKVIFDHGNGVTAHVMPKLMQAFPIINSNHIYAEMNGLFPNHAPDPTIESNLAQLKQQVMILNADLGIAFDGDGDRIGIITNSGKFISADYLLALFAKEILKKQPNSPIIYDIKCSMIVEKAIRTYGGIPVMSKTGHSNIKQQIKKHNAPLGGEFSGHICFADKWYGFDDAIYSAIRLLEILSSTNLSLDNLLTQFETTYHTAEIKIPIEDSEKFKLIEQLKNKAYFHTKQIITIDGIKAIYPNGWGIIRASNTTPNITLRFEATSKNDLSAIKNIFIKALKNHPSLLPLPKELDSE